MKVIEHVSFADFTAAVATAVEAGFDVVVEVDVEGGAPYRATVGQSEAAPAR